MDTLYFLDQLACDKSTIAGWDQIQAPHDVSDITMAGPSHSNNTTEATKELEDTTEPAPTQEHVVGLSSLELEPTADTPTLHDRPGLQVPMMNSIIHEVISSQRLAEPCRDGTVGRQRRRRIKSLSSNNTNLVTPVSING